MKKSDETTGIDAILMLIICVPLAILVSIYGAQLLVKITQWYNLPFTLNYKQAFGINAFFSIITIGLSKENKKTFSESISGLIVNVILISLLWGVYYLVSLFM